MSNRRYHATPLPAWHPEVWEPSRERIQNTTRFYRVLATGGFDDKGRFMYPFSEETSNKLGAYRGGPWR